MCRALYVLVAVTAVTPVKWPGVGRSVPEVLLLPACLHLGVSSFRQRQPHRGNAGCFSARVTWWQLVARPWRRRGVY